MLPRAFTAVIERNITLTADLLTEPYETAWAGEARWFIHVLDAAPGTVMEVASQVSPEGLTWCDHEAAPVSHEGAGLFTLAIRNVGPWARLRCNLSGPQARAKVIIYLTLRA